MNPSVHRANASMALTIFVVLSLAVTACSRGGPVPQDSLTGTWRGTFESTVVEDATGEVAANLIQVGNEVSGTATITGSPCISEGSISGTASDGNVALGVLSGEESLSFEATYTDTSMSGSYTVPQGECSGDEGTFRLNKE